MIDGFNDSGLHKLNSLTVRRYDVNKNQVNIQLLSKCLTSGAHAGTAETIFEKTEKSMEKFGTSWQFFVGFGVDNVPVNLGKKNSIMSRILKKYKQCYFMGCPSHLTHNISAYASNKFRSIAASDMEDFIFYWFDKSANRKRLLASY